MANVAALSQPIVIDNGSGVIKAGLAGDLQPSVVFSNFVGRPKHTRAMVGALEGEFFIGKDAEENRGLLKVHYPMEHGIVTDWNDMERVWRHTYSELRTHSEEHPVLLTEAPLNPRKNREKSAEILFERFGAPALSISMQAVLSLYATGRTTGVVLDIGDGVTHAVPIYQGFALPHAIQRVDLAGRDITDHLQLLLHRSGCGYKFRTSAEKEIVRQIKEQVCYVTKDPQRQEEQLEADDKINVKNLVEYKLPDGTVIHIGPEAFRAPEILFRPDLIGEEYTGVHQTVYNSIMRSDLDMRRHLFSNVVLSGSSTLFPGFGARLFQELVGIAPKEIKVKISAPNDRKFSTWIGGSILAALPTFKKMWVWREEYEEEGARILHRKTF